jgi:hypothetical protein
MKAIAEAAIASKKRVAKMKRIIKHNEHSN